MGVFLENLVDNRTKLLMVHMTVLLDDLWDYLNKTNSAACIQQFYKSTTLLGKIAVIKSLATSQTVYVLSSLSTCNDTLREVNNLLYDFLWDGKGDKIKRTVMVNGYENGGLQMLDIFTFNKSL